MKLTFKRFSFDSAQVDLGEFFSLLFKLGLQTVDFLVRMIGGIILAMLVLLVAFWCLSFWITWVLIAIAIAVGASAEGRRR